MQSMDESILSLVRGGVVTPEEGANFLTNRELLPAAARPAPSAPARPAEPGPTRQAA